MRRRVLALLVLSLSLVAGDGKTGTGEVTTTYESRFTGGSASGDGGDGGAGATGEATTTASSSEEERPLPGLWWFAPVLSGGGYCSEANALLRGLDTLPPGRPSWPTVLAPPVILVCP
jgi:hypothetical protein